MQGLTTKEAEEALKKYGTNELPTKQRSSAVKLLIGQFKNALSLLLFIAVLLSFVVGSALDASLILAILLLNGMLGFWQEYKASKELEALRKMEVAGARVLRDGHEMEIPASRIVPGDIVLLEAGDKIPADGKVVESISLAVNESSLTGESLSVMKSENKDENQLFFGTIAVSGRGKFLVESTGVSTRFGKIALNLAEVEEENTPLELALSSFGKTVGIIALIVAVFIFIIRTLQGFEIFEVFFTSIALMVAAVPEGLPAVVTIVLAIGVQRMYREKALVRKMVAVESLGAASVICTDKTGTLTKNEMRVKKVEVESHLKSELLRAAVLCNSASLVLKEDQNGYDMLGDTTEGALLLWAKEEGKDIDFIKSSGKLVEEIPFNLNTRMMTVIWEENGKRDIYSKGAPEVILNKCALTEKEKEEIVKRYEKMASTGLRVLAFASAKDNKEKMKYLGIIGIADAPRPEAREAIQAAREAGIKVIMVTGDNELTAKAIAEEVGLISEGEEVLTGQQLDELNDAELKTMLSKIRVFARIQPEQKLRIVKAYQAMGEVVAVTGDGVNDALALKQAQVGVSMGITGTDVAKEASDIVLLDDNFATLIVAVEQGRLFYSNILKVIKFLLAGNLSEILLIVIASLLALPTPLLPAQILWINFVTDGFPALALGTDTASSHLMKVPPRRNSVLLNKEMLTYIFIIGFVMSAISLAGFYFALTNYGLEIARSTAFSLVVVSQMVMVFVIRKHHSPFSNKNLLLSVGFVLLMQVLILTFEPLKILFRIQ